MNKIHTSLTVTFLCAITLTTFAQDNLKNAQGVENGRQALQEGDYEKAITYLNTELKQNSNNGYANYEMARVYHEMGNTIRAKEYINKAISTLPKTDEEALAEAQNCRGDILKDETDYETALEAYRAAILSAPNVMTYRVNMAHALIEMDRLDEAEKEFNYILEKDAENVEALNGLGEIYMINDNLDKAQKTLNKAVKYSKEQNVESLVLRATCNQNLGLFIEAVEDLLKALIQNPKDEEILTDLARLAGFEDNMETVISTLESHQKAEPGNNMWSYFLGYVCRVQGRAQEGIEYYNRANKIDEQAFIYEAIADCYQDLENQPSALEQINIAMQKDTSAYYISARAAVYKHFNDYVNAINDYQAYLKKDPKNANANYQIAACNYSMNYYARAKQYADKAVNLMSRKDPATDRAYFLNMQALCLIKRGKTSDANKNFSQVLNMRGAGSYPRAVAAARLGQTDKALEIAQENIDTKEVHFTQAAIYSITEDYEKCYKELNQALQLGEVSPYTLVSCADLENVKDTEEFMLMVQDALGKKWQLLEDQKKK